MNMCTKYIPVAKIPRGVEIFHNAMPCQKLRRPTKVYNRALHIIKKHLTPSVILYFYHMVIF